MKTVIEYLEDMIATEKNKLELARRALNRADANDVNLQLVEARSITKLAIKVQALENLLKKLKEGA